jgi:hypothetical protein
VAPLHRLRDAAASVTSQPLQRLTGNLWDAQGRVYDVLLRAFGSLGCLHAAAEAPSITQVLRSCRAVLFRTIAGTEVEAVFGTDFDEDTFA